MDIRALRTIVMSLAVLALLPSVAAAAAPAQIQRDAADGSIDGEYTLAEMRAADRSVSAEQREYYGWEDVYRDYVRSLAQPAPAEGASGVVARRADDDSAKQSEASDRSPSSQTGAEPSTDAAVDARDRVTAAGSDAGTGDERIDGTDSVATNADEVTVADAGGGFPFVFVLMAIPLLVLAVGAWRAKSSRAARDRKHEAQLG